MVGIDLVAEGLGITTHAFPLSRLSTKVLGNIVTQLIAEHSSEGNTPILRREVVLPVHHTAGQLARSALDDAIPPPALNGRSDDPRLALTELVSNAVRHAGLEANEGLIHLLIEADDDHVRVEIEQPTSASGVHVVERPGTDGRSGGSACDWCKPRRMIGGSSRGRPVGSGSSSGSKGTA